LYHSAKLSEKENGGQRHTCSLDLPTYMIKLRAAISGGVIFSKHHVLDF
jgi:hypothetical protein